ncbi:unnamed protein product [Chironomus riparius]|uniref:Uncharacterized protein n=1 Tax=Chironomus riparius TaxID=315576 RepID=A0A9N9WVI6_9DIPT|nr:unnamed protein product [Chironomus riparius]
MDLSRSNNRTLFDVISCGDDVALQRLLLEGKEERNVATLAHGNTLLHEAAWKGYSRCVKLLCNVYPKDIDDNSNKEKLNKKKQQFINRPNFCGFTALHLASQNGHNQSTRELLYAGCSTTIQNDYGDSPLHTSVRYGHAGVLRILISAKCDIDAFNHNHDTPLHISAAIGRRKLTKLLVEAGAMQFRNNQNETPRDIAKRKNFQEILEIIDTQPDKIDKKLIRDSLRKSKSSTNHQCLPHNISNDKSNYKLKNNNSNNDKDLPTQLTSPYGCHYYPDPRKFPSPKLQTLPKEPLQVGEIYYLDLAGNIRKGALGINRCSCAPYSKEAMIEHCKNIQKYVDKANDKLNKKIVELTTKIEKTDRKYHQREKSKDRDKDPLYPLLKIVGDKNKQIHLEKWLTKVYPEARSDLQSPQSSEFVTKEIPVDVHRSDHQSSESQRAGRRETIKVLRASSRRHDDIKSQNTIDAELENDDSYTDISNDDDDGSMSNNDNPLYDEAFMRKFQQQQQFTTYANDSVTSPSINSNQNIEMEMEKIAKSLLASEEDVMISSHNPDVIKDHVNVSHSAKRSTKKIKSAITKPTSVLSSGDLYVNSFFNHDGSDGHRNRYQYSPSDIDEVDSCEIDRLVSKVQETILSSNYTSDQYSHHDINGNENQILWNRGVGRSRNAIAINTELTYDIENYADNLFKTQPDEENGDLKVQNNISDNNFILLDKLLKARKQLNQTYHQHLHSMSNNNNSTDENGNSNNTNNYIPSSSLV